MKPRRVLAVLAFALAFVLALVGCGGNAGSSASGSASGASESAAASGSGDSSAASAESASASASADASSAATGELAGKPWVTSIVQGNLPAEQPEAKNDLFTHYDYEYLAAHQEQPSSAIADHAAELQATNLAAIKDASKSGHDLDQLRIFFDQAADAEGLQKKGLADLQPYLDRIDAVTSIEEMNALLSADDFPFSPFVIAYITVSDTRDVNIVSVSPNLALVDTLAVGGAYYQDSDDPQVQQSMEAAIRNISAMALVDLMATGLDNGAVQEMFPRILEFEKAHGKYVDYNGKYSQQDFGAMAEAARAGYFTLDELCAACPNFPMKATLDKMGKGASPRYASTREWLQAFNGVWTSENIDAIKTIAKMRILAETRPYRDPSVMNALLEQAGQPVPDAEAFAYTACNQQDTFAILLAKTYVDEALGPNAKPRLTDLSKQIIDAYKGLIDNTPWMGEESQQRIIEKLDHITLNVLEPVGGYYDFSGLELTPTDKGGTLIGNYLKLRQYR